MRIFDAVQQQEQFRVVRQTVERQRPRRRSEGYNTLMRLPGCSLVERGAWLKPNKNPRVAAQVDDLLDAGPSGTFGHQHAVERPSCSQRLANRVNPDQNAHGPMLPGVSEMRRKADLSCVKITH
jgi:hypothetical protein